MRSLMTDLIEVYAAPTVITNLGEHIRKMADAVPIGSGYGSLQLYFSAEYDVDRDTLQRLGRVISDDYNLYSLVTHQTWVLSDGVMYEVDGDPQKWTLRGLHHIEFNVKRLTDGV